MTDDPSMDPEELQRLLRAIEGEASSSTNRDAIRRAMITEFDEHVADSSDASTGAGDTVSLIDLDEPPLAARRGRHVPGLLLAAAAVLLIVAITIGITRGNDDEGIETEAIELPTPTSEDPSVPAPPGVPLGPGPLDLPSVAGGVSFEIPGGLFLVEEQAGSVQLVTGDVNDPGTVTLLETDLLPADLARSIETMVQEENAVSEELTMTGPTGPVTRWRLRLPPTFFQPADCVATQCVVVPILRDLADPPRLFQGRDTFISIVEVDERRLLLIEQPGIPTDAVAEAGPQIIFTLTAAG